MHIKHGIGRLDSTNKQQHRYHQKHNGSKKQLAGDGAFVEIGSNHGHKHQHKSHFCAGLEGSDQAQPFYAGG